MDENFFRTEPSYGSDLERLLVENSPVGMVFADKKLIFRYISPVSMRILQPMEDYLGRTPKSLLGASLLSFHKNPKTVSNVLSNPANLPYKFQLQIGPQLVGFTANAVYDNNRDLIGYMVTWQALEA